MNKLILTAVVSLLAANFALAQAPAPAAAEKKPAAAAEKKADAKAAAAKPEAKADGKTRQQEKMKACNKEAGEKQLKGDERKKFMSSCLKG